MDESSELLPKLFDAASEVLPLTKHGVSTISEFRKAEDSLNHLEWLKSIGLSKEEIGLYEDNETGRIERRQIESGVLETRLEAIHQKICNSASESRR